MFLISFRGVGVATYDPCMVPKVFQWLQLEYVSRQLSCLDSNEWAIINGSYADCLQQDNNYDCGIYVLGYVWALITSKFQDCSNFKERGMVLYIRSWLLGTLFD